MSELQGGEEVIEFMNAVRGCSSTVDAEAETGTEDKAETKFSSAVTRRFFFLSEFFTL